MAVVAAARARTKDRLFIFPSGQSGEEVYFRLPGKGGLARLDATHLVAPFAQYGVQPNGAIMRTKNLSYGVFTRASDLGDYLFKRRVVDAMNDDRSRYPIIRGVVTPVRCSVSEAVDRLASGDGWRTIPVDQHDVVLEGSAIWAKVGVTRNPEFTALDTKVWAATADAAEKFCQDLLELFSDVHILDPNFTVDWYYRRAGGFLGQRSIMETFNDVLLDAAYPQLIGGVSQFIRGFLDAPEPILLLQGPPGTGKTRLIRAILGALGAQKDHQASVMYASDPDVLESDEVFATFVTQRTDAFVIEDADYLLRARSDGNRSVHRFLGVGDGIMRSRGRKLIFSTNLPNLGDIDDALLRPGRCYAHLVFRLLSLNEAHNLLAALEPDDVTLREATYDSLRLQAQRGYSVAEIYRARQTEKRLRRSPGSYANNGGAATAHVHAAETR